MKWIDPQFAIGSFVVFRKVTYSRPMNKLYLVLAIAIVVSCTKEPIPPPPGPVNPLPVKKINITDTAALLLQGSTFQLQAYFPAGVDSSAGISWTSTDTSVASVNAQGTVQGKEKGQSFIIARDQRNAALSDSTPVLCSRRPCYPPGGYCKQYEMAKCSVLLEE